MRRSSALLAALVLTAVTAPAALAGAGGGSSGFSGGGGGGGGGFSGGGGGYGGGAGGGISGGFVVLIVLGVLVFLIAGAISIWRYNRKRAARVKRVTTAAAEAAEDDPAFAADAVGQSAADLYLACQAAWDKRDQAALEQLVGDDLLVEWKRRLDDFAKKKWHNRVTVHGRPTVEYLGLVNRAGEAEDRVVVRICATQDDWVQLSGGGTVMKEGETDKTVSVEEWWTLARRDGRWIVVSIESEAEGRHNLDSEIVAVPEADDERLRDESTIEVAQADAAPADVKTAEIADLDFAGDARAAALDLSLADARFAPDVLEVAVRRAVAGWAEAIDGEDAPLLAVAAPEAARKLLYPRSEQTRLVVRGPRIRQLRITKLDAAADPARMSVEVDVTGRRYVEDRDTAAVVSGSKSSETSFTERWTLAIDGPSENPWRIVEAQ
ncbi:MAG: import inner rane translocase subunit Tim44 [Solirubrobacterales bacterium]|nr:import inner rane translocase subunit Tim44 [Solirubrobacterales bacterium]